jgi:hypothetical protein
MNLKLFKSTILIFSVLAFMASCKPEDTVKEYLRGGNSLAITTDGNLVIAGYNTTSTKSYDANLLLCSPNGDTLWSRKYGGSYSDAFFSVKNSNTGGFIAAGFSNQASSSSPAMIVVIAGPDGSLVKSAKFGGSNYSQGFSVVANSNPDSGYLVAGYIQKIGRVDRDIYLVRIDNEGKFLWEKSIGAISKDPYDTVSDAAYGIIPAQDSGYYITGSINAGFSTGQGKIFLMKVSQKGDSLWTKTYATGIGYSLTLTSDGGVAIGGTLQETSNNDIILLKTDALGNLLWSKVYGGTGYEYGASMIETSDGGFAITGITDSKGAGYDDVYLIRTNSAGDLQWDKTYGGSNVDQGYGIVQRSDGGFSVTGLSNSGGSFIYLNGIAADGTQLWFKNLQ